MKTAVTKYRRSLVVEAVQLAGHNVFTVAHWCDGEVTTGSRIKLCNYESGMIEYAHLGQWIVRYNDDLYSVLDDDYFQAEFQECE